MSCKIPSHEKSQPYEASFGHVVLRDKQSRKLWLSQQWYVDLVIKKFNYTMLVNHFKLSKMSCPFSQDEKESMTVIPYSPANGSLMYALVCTMSGVPHAVEVVSKFLSNLVKEH